MKARTAARTSSALRKIRPHTACSLRVRMNRSATPLVSGWRTKAKLGVRPRKAIWVWTWSDIKALPWSWRSRRPRAASARTAPQAVWMARSRAWAAAKRLAFSATCQPLAVSLRHHGGPALVAAHQHVDGGVVQGVEDGEVALARN